MSEDRLYVIWSFEHDAWWRPGKSGYTPLLSEAGHYTKADADAIVADANRYLRDGDLHEVAMRLSEAQAVRPDPASITCPQCGAVSYNLHDIRERYCGRCHQFHEFMS